MAHMTTPISLDAALAFHTLEEYVTAKIAVKFETCAVRMTYEIITHERSHACNQE